ncbi:hypothetical protein C0J52_25742 [Blattella germanica]|nr:hypothetical protein C0J52_25742 [Blattella germanica]
MADEADVMLESALERLLSVTEISGKLRKDVKLDICESVSTVRNIFFGLKNELSNSTSKISKLENEVKVVQAKLDESLTRRSTEQVATSLGGTLIAATSSGSSGPDVVSSGGGGRKLFSDVVSGNADKRYKLTVKSKSNHSTESIKNILKSRINPTEIKVGIKTFKSLKDGRVLIETGSKDEVQTLSTKINAHCGKELDVRVPALRKPRIVIYNTPQDVTIDNAEETILNQNPELNLNPGDITAKFTFRTKNEQTNMFHDTLNLLSSSTQTLMSVVVAVRHRYAKWTKPTGASRVTALNGDHFISSCYSTVNG